MINYKILLQFIDISTSHNITIRYELATVLHRIFAWMIDAIVLFSVMMVISIIGRFSWSLWYLLFILFVGMYHLLCEIFNNGQSIGKYALKLKVVTLHGRTAKPQDYFLRWIFRMLEITFCFGMLAMIYVSSTEKHQRIGDILAQTTVVKLRPDALYDLSSLLRFNHVDRDIRFPKVIMYTDEDMMLVKESINRLQENPNPETQRFVKVLAERFASDMDYSGTISKSSEFLEVLLLDYIRLTR